MNVGAQRLQAFLDQAGVEYQVLHHRRDMHATATAADTHTPRDEFAKTVFLWIDGEPAMAVTPATRHVALSKVARALGAEEVRLATESDIAELCPDCEIGAAPPFGNLYGLPVYVSRALAADEQITFNGGDHENAFRMAFGDYEALVSPQVITLAKYDA